MWPAHDALEAQYPALDAGCKIGVSNVAIGLGDVCLKCGGLNEFVK